MAGWAPPRWSAVMRQRRLTSSRPSFSSVSATVNSRLGSSSCLVDSDGRRCRVVSMVGKAGDEATNDDHTGSLEDLPSGQHVTDSSAVGEDSVTTSGLQAP
ncbi:hypothetical protein Dimus_033905 [Dionaea muscipula]